MPATTDTPEPRPIGRSILLGVTIGVAAGATVYFLIAIPIYLVASFEANGMDRPIIRTGLLKVALPFGVLFGIGTGVASGRWLRRGGRWTVEDGGDRYTTR